MSELAKVIQKAAGTYGIDSVVMMACKVDSVNIDNRSCMVSPINNNIASFEAFLMAETDDGVLILPTEGSTVKILFSNLNSPTVIQYSQIDKMLIIAGDTTITVYDGTAIMQQGAMSITLSGGKINIKNGDVDYKTIMDKHFDNLAAMTFTNGAGVTGVANNVSAINADKTDFDKLFN